MMAKLSSRNTAILSLGFFLIFFGFDGVQQFITSFFAQKDLASVGFNSLILIYLFFSLGEPLAAIFISRFGAKIAMILAVLFYSLYIFSLTQRNIYVIYLFSGLLGLAASFLWTGQNSYLVRASSRGNYGREAGFFNTIRTAGSGLGVLVLGFLIGKLSFPQAFIISGLVVLAGFFPLASLLDIRARKVENYWKLLRHSILSPIALRLSTVFFALFFVLGLMIGIVPITVSKNVGQSWVGIIMSLFYLLPIFLSYKIGSLSDNFGRTRLLNLSFIIGIGGLVLLIAGGSDLILIVSVILLALNSAIANPLTLAFVGDISSSGNLEFLTALFWLARSLGAMGAFLLATIMTHNNIYIVAIAVLLGSLFLVRDLFSESIFTVKTQLSREIK